MGEETMTSAYENAMSDLQANNATQQYPVTQSPDRRAEFWIYLNTHSAAEIDRTTIVQFWSRAETEMTNRTEAAEAERDEARRQLEQAQKLIERLYLAWIDAPLEIGKREDRSSAMTDAALIHYEAQP